MPKIVQTITPIEYSRINGQIKLLMPFGACNHLNSQADKGTFGDLKIRAKVDRKNGYVTFFCRHGLSNLFSNKSEKNLARQLMFAEPDSKSLKDCAYDFRQYLRSGRLSYDGSEINPDFKKLLDSNKSNEFKTLVVVPDTTPEPKKFFRLPSLKIGESEKAPEPKYPVLEPSKINGYRLYHKTTYEKGEHENHRKPKIKRYQKPFMQEEANKLDFKHQYFHRYCSEYASRSENIYNFCLRLQKAGLGDRHLYIYQGKIKDTNYHFDLLFVSIPVVHKSTLNERPSRYKFGSWLGFEKVAVKINTVVAMGRERINQVVPENHLEDVDNHVSRRHKSNRHKQST